MSAETTAQNCRDCAHKTPFTFTTPAGREISFEACGKDSMPVMKADNKCVTFERAEKEKSDV